MTGSELHGRVSVLLPRDAPMRGFLHGVNAVLREIRQRGLWSWLLKEGAITTTVEYATGTVSVTQGSATVTGSGTTFTSGMVGRRFRTDDGIQYTISAYVSGTEVTLSTAYAGTSGSGLTYRIYQDIYSLPSDCVSLQSWWNAQNRTWIRARTRSEVYGAGMFGDFRSGWTEVAAMWGYSAAGVRQVLLWPAPVEAMVIPLLYTRGITVLTGPGATVDVPAALELTLVEGVKWRMLEGIEGVEKGVIEHQANRFRSMLDRDWRENQAEVPSEICMVDSVVDDEAALRLGWGVGRV